MQGRGAIAVGGKRSEPTYAYTLPEIEKIIDAVENSTHRALQSTQFAQAQTSHMATLA
jgi:hypothetical protein